MHHLKCYLQIPLTLSQQKVQSLLSNSNFYEVPPLYSITVLGCSGCVHQIGQQMHSKPNKSHLILHLQRIWSFIGFEIGMYMISTCPLL